MIDNNINELNLNELEKKSNISTSIPKDIDVKIKRWLEYERLIFMKNKELKALKTDKKSLEDEILDFMEQSKIGSFTSDGGGYSIKLNKTETKSSIKESIIFETLEQKKIDNLTVKKIIEEINAKRKINEKISLKKNEFKR